MANQLSSNKVKLTLGEYCKIVEEFSNPPVKFKLPEATWRDILFHANEIMGDAGRSFLLKSDAARMIISYYFYKIMDRILTKYPSLSGYAQVLQKTSHPDFPVFTLMFLENEGAAILIPEYVRQQLPIAHVIYDDDGLDEHLLYPLRKVKSRCA